MTAHNNIINANILNAREAFGAVENRNQFSPEALTYFGTALHPVQDATSPAHAGFLAWGPVDMIFYAAHNRKEAEITDDQLATAVQSTRDLFLKAFGSVALNRALGIDDPTRSLDYFLFQLYLSQLEQQRETEAVECESCEP